MRLPLFVFLQRQFLQPRSEHEERLSFRSDCRAAKRYGGVYHATEGTGRNETEMNKKLMTMLAAMCAAVCALAAEVPSSAEVREVGKYLDELTKANRNVENIRSQIKDYVDDASQARLAAEEANKELRVLRAKVDELQGELKKRTTVIRYDNDKVENARDMLSREIDEAINSPLSRPTVQQTYDPNRK